MNRLFLILLVVFATACTHTPVEGDRGPASAAPGLKTHFKVEPYSCQSLFDWGTQSKDIEQVRLATRVCNEAVKAVCTNLAQRNTTELAIAECVMKAEHAAHSAVRSGDNDRDKCDGDFNDYLDSSDKDISQANAVIETCSMETDAVCHQPIKTSKPKEALDLQLRQASCDFRAMHGAYSAFPPNQSRAHERRETPRPAVWDPSFYGGTAVHEGE
jgi:hypothetical protein